MDQYLNFFKTKYIPAYEKYFAGVKVYIIKGLKGECINCNGYILAWKNKTDMEKYWNQDGSATGLGKTAVINCSLYLMN